MPCAHQIPAAVLPGPHQVPGCFLIDAGDRHRGDLVQAQQPGQMHGITGVGLDPIPGGFLQLGGSDDLAPHL